MPFVCHSKILRKRCLQFLLGHFNSQEKLKTILMQNFGVTNKEHYGVLWYFLEWSIDHFPSSKNSHFQNEAKCKIFVVKMRFSCMRIQIVFISMGLHLTSLWNRFETTLKWPIPSTWTHMEIRSTCNRQISRWRYLTTSRIHFVFLFLFKFCNPRGVSKTKGVICTRKRNPKGFW